MQEYINGKVLINNKLVQKDFLIKDNKIYFDYEKTDNPKDISDLVVSPSFIDLHVHTRTPGFTESEDIEHVSKAAIAGGFTTIVAMANINPIPKDLKSLKEIQSILDDSPINIIQAGRVTQNNKLVNIKEMSSFTEIFTDDGLPIEDEELMKSALETIKKVDGVILLHEEDHSLKGVGYRSKFTQDNNLPSFGSEYEYKIVERDIRLNRDIGANMHLQHISTHETLTFLHEVKYFKNISAEVTPHHLFFSNEDIDGSTNFKMNPPLNSKQVRDSLRKAIRTGVVSIISTDHAPHAKEKKEGNWLEAANGIIGLETAFAASYTAVGDDYLEQVLMAMSVNPGKRINMDVSLKNGADANLVFINPNKKWTVSEKDLKSKSKNSPFIGKTLKGTIEEVLWVKR